MAPEAFCTSPQISPRAPTLPAASTARNRNCKRAPLVISPARTAWTPIHKTPDTPPKTRPITRTVITARADMREREAEKALSTAPEKRVAAAASRPKAWTVSSWSRLSPA